MTGKSCIWLLTVFFLTAVAFVEAQQAGKDARIGYLDGSTAAGSAELEDGRPYVLRSGSS